MGNSLRCCLACVLPCGALDMVRVVHLSGRVEEYGRPVAAGEILAANPNHVLSKPCSQGVVRRILIVSPGSELERGEIYFLIPASSAPERRRKKSRRSASAASSHEQKAAPSSSCSVDGKTCSRLAKGKRSSSGHGGDEVPSDQKRPPLHRRRMSAGGRTAAWRPQLECIVEGT